MFLQVCDSYRGAFLSVTLGQIKDVLNTMSESDYDSERGMRVRLAASDAINELNDIGMREYARGY